jgi:ribosomal-protein-alanine N-acetyltransferase
MPDLTSVILTTERLKLRWMDERDIPAHFAVFSDPEVTRYWSGEPWTDIAQSAEAIAATIASYGSKYWGQGYVTEALEAMIRYGFDVLDLNRIEADIDPLNIGSARVLEKLGFRKEGYMPERWIVGGKTADTVNYGLLRRYWHER